MWYLYGMGIAGAIVVCFHLYSMIEGITCACIYFVTDGDKSPDPPIVKFVYDIIHCDYTDPEEVFPFIIVSLIAAAGWIISLPIIIVVIFINVLRSMYRDRKFENELRKNYHDRVGIEK